MTNQLIPQDAVFLKEGHPVTTSIKNAEVFGRRHDTILQSVRELDCSDEFRRQNFLEATYRDAQNKPRPMFELTKDGFAFLVMGFTGPTAARFKEAYIRRFNEMAVALGRQCSDGVFVPNEQMTVINQHLTDYIELLKAKIPKPRKKPTNNGKKLTNELMCRFYDLVGQGLSQRAIAEELAISEAMVSYMKRIRPNIIIPISN